MGTILTTQEYASIREKIGIGTDELSDATIDTLSILPAAEANIMNAIPTYATLTGANLALMKAATVTLTAAYALMALQSKRDRAISTGDYSEGASQIDYAAMRNALISETWTNVKKVQNALTPASTSVTMFAIASNASARKPVTMNDWLARVNSDFANWAAGLSSDGVNQ